MLQRRIHYVQISTVVLIVTAIVGACVTPTTSVPAPTKPPPPADTVAPETPEAPHPTKEPAFVPIMLVDGLDRSVSLPEPALRVISMAPNTTEILYAVGAGSQIVGRDEFSDFPPEVVDVASIGSTYAELNTEAMIALEPDLILAAGIHTPEQVQSLEALNLTVFYLSNPEDFEELYEALRLVGVLTDHEDDAVALGEELKSRVDAVIETVAGVDPILVYYEVDGSDPTAPWTTGSGTFQDIIIRSIGGENVASDLENWATISLEELVERDPKVMFYGAGPWVPTTPESVAERSGWGDITAVATGAIYGIETNWVDRIGPRLVGALEQMARLLHPALFE
jgi:iron complex transport system substrate-binding protein